MSALPESSASAGAGPIADAGDSAPPRFWRTLQEQRGHAPEQVTGWNTDALQPSSRRHFMKLMAASLALAGTGGCSREPLETIVPYRSGPLQTTYGKPVFYASALPRDGYGAGVLVECNMGRPTKIEGNPLHPASLGATDAIAQAEVLQLWDPERSQAIRGPTGLSTWNDFVSALNDRLSPLRAEGGEGVYVLSDVVTSPAIHMQLTALRRQMPGLHWHQYATTARHNAYEGTRLAYGTALETVYRFDKARTIVALDAEFLDGAPGAVRYARDFSASRNAFATNGARNRLYVAECTPSLTGAAADHRIAIRAADIALIAHALAHSLGIAPAPATAPVPAVAAWLDAALADLKRDAGASLVIVGDRQPPGVHAIAHLINARLGSSSATLLHTAPVAAEPVDPIASLRELVTAMHDGRVQALLLLDVNPVYTAPPELAFARALGNVPFSVHSGLYRDETGLRCHWHIPGLHALELWSDVRAFDGTVSIVQPCIAPLVDGRSAHSMLAALAGDFALDTRELVRQRWRDTLAGEFEKAWRDSLRDGVVAGTAFPPQQPNLRRDVLAWPQPTAESELELVLLPDPRIGDGRYANNAWLQELPKPLTQLTWDNAALVSPALAQRMGLESEDVVELRRGNLSVKAPVWIMPGQADQTVTLHLGYGRSAAGEVGNAIGVDAFALRTADATTFAQGLSVTRTGARYRLASAQGHSSMEGRDIVRVMSLERAAACADRHCASEIHSAPTLYDSPPQGPYAWAMSIDLGACIGCSACTVACQAENNIPTVGKQEVRRGREMHWIRVDRYYEGSPALPRAVFQPVPCMHCEHAPCEPVCPVEASVHDAQGLNVQVYNRCVGTRFCSNNCPYKVRRFNFFQYTKDEPHLNAQRNPEVTVRMRGVMEKCNYCLQRITNARIEADKDGRRIRDGEVVTACQAVCPTQAISFGDLNDPASEVNKRKDSPLDYALLAELNTRPRTSYLARVVNPSPALPGDSV
ncbi:MAG: 4Fe-4S dicluster domain-containing protein [Pseudomonadota bacterium]|nr:4Fe-4S dicluster domain-containing protein [Pseudomonadota bacterium]